MMVEVVRRPTSWAACDDFEPFGGVELVGAEFGPHLVVEDFRGGAGQAGEAGFAQFFEIGGEGAGRALLAPCRISSGEKAWICICGTASFTVRHKAR